MARADLIDHTPQAVGLQPPQVGGIFDLVEQRHGGP
jgi:hypothetical protein